MLQTFNASGNWEIKTQLGPCTQHVTHDNHFQYFGSSEDLLQRDTTMPSSSAAELYLM
jgi:hypothetical protein